MEDDKITVDVKVDEVINEIVTLPVPGLTISRDTPIQNHRLTIDPKRHAHRRERQQILPSKIHNHHLHVGNNFAEILVLLLLSLRLRPNATPMLLKSWSSHSL